MPTLHTQLLVEIVLETKPALPRTQQRFLCERRVGRRGKVGLQHNKEKTSLWLSWDFRILCFYFYKNGLICLRLLLSITAGSPGERWEAENSGNLPKEKSMKQINPSQAAMTQ